MKSNHERAERMLRKTRRAQRFSYPPTPILKARPFDAIAYAAALEVLG
jgi:hypothetical protein